MLYEIPVYKMRKLKDAKGNGRNEQGGAKKRIDHGI